MKKKNVNVKDVVKLVVKEAAVNANEFAKQITGHNIREDVMAAYEDMLDRTGAAIDYKWRSMAATMLYNKVKGYIQKKVKYEKHEAIDWNRANRYYISELEHIMKVVYDRIEEAETKAA